MNGFSQFFYDRIYVAEWFAAVGTVAAVGWLVYDATKGARKRQRADHLEKQRADAYAVGISSREVSNGHENYLVRFTVANYSPAPVHNVVVQFPDWGRDANKSLGNYMIGTVLPTKEVTDTLPIIGYSFGAVYWFETGPAAVEFDDRWGTRWRLADGNCWQVPALKDEVKDLLRKAMRDGVTTTPISDLLGDEPEANEWTP